MHLVKLQFGQMNFRSNGLSVKWCSAKWRSVNRLFTQMVFGQKAFGQKKSVKRFFIIISPIHLTEHRLAEHHLT
jgi:hypothetical protein